MHLLFFPFSFLFAMLTNIRNLLFDMSILPSKKFDIPVICIGNLSTGGTGKTPHTDYIISLLKENYNVAIVSRGYGRKTKGFKEVKSDCSPNKVGEEALLLKQKHPNCIVVIDEERKNGIERILKDYTEIDVILMDDGFQHRRVNAGLNILLTTLKSPYYKDYLLPMGTLRESKRNAKRAEIIVVSKSPKEINPTEKKKIIQQLNLNAIQYCFFSEIQYGNWRCLSVKEELNPVEKYNIILVTAIADATPLAEQLKENGHSITHLEYRDHHHFTKNDVKKILNNYKEDKSAKKLILTTEKDAVKLKPFEKDFENVNIYFAPINIRIRDKEEFDNQIEKYVRTNKRNC